jgi:hypothetical protein
MSSKPFTPPNNRYDTEAKVVIQLLTFKMDRQIQSTHEYINPLQQHGKKSGRGRLSLPEWLYRETRENN